MKTDPITQTTYRAGLLQSQAYRALTNFMNRQLTSAHITLPEWSALAQLVTSPTTLRPTDIATSLAIKQPVATRLLRGLEAKNLIKRRADSSDRRAVALSLTVQGKTVTTQIEHQLRTEMKLFLNDITPAELATYLTVMERIAAKV